MNRFYDLSVHRPGKRQRYWMFKTLASVGYEGGGHDPPGEAVGVTHGGLFNVTSACISLLRLGNIHSTFHCIVLTQSFKLKD